MRLLEKIRVFVSFVKLDMSIGEILWLVAGGKEPDRTWAKTHGDLSFQDELNRRSGLR